MKKIIIDTDAGVDDATAILMAFRHPSTTVKVKICLLGFSLYPFLDENIFE